MSRDLASRAASAFNQDAAGADTGPESLSAWVDGELDPAQADRLLRALRVDPALQARWLAHHVVSDALKSSDVACLASATLRERICRALDDEPALVAPRGRGVLPRRWTLPAAGLVAAAVVLAVGMPRAWFERGPTVATVVPDASGSVVGSPALALTRGRPPLLPTGSAQLQRDPRLEAYLRAHRELGDSGVLPQAVMYLRGGEDER